MNRKDEFNEDIDVAISTSENKESSGDNGGKKLFICSAVTFIILFCICGLLSLIIKKLNVFGYYMFFCVEGIVIASFFHSKKLAFKIFYSVIAVSTIIGVGGILYQLHLFSNIVDAKPIIYIYPQETTNVNVSVGNPKLLTCTYPRYDEKEGWNVVAEPNGDLTYQDGRKLYALYWEGRSKNDKGIRNDGFIVKGEDTIDFLEEKLALLGLNEREAEEFIVYWLPQMESNKYNYIRFETMDEIDANMPLNITPKPDTTIRVMMDWCAIDSEREANKLKDRINEQELITPERTGFVAVEWGGSIIE